MLRNKKKSHVTNISFKVVKALLVCYGKVIWFEFIENSHLNISQNLYFYYYFRWKFMKCTCFWLRFRTFNREIRFFLLFYKNQYLKVNIELSMTKPLRFRYVRNKKKSLFLSAHCHLHLSSVKARTTVSEHENRPIT